MKLKYLLASGLFLSTAFVACTNDDFAEISAPVNTDGAIALGEGFTIEVNKGGVDTRAAFDAKYTPYWEKDDQLGAAWVHMVTEVEEKDGVYTATQVSPVGSSSDKFYSNHPFNLIEGENTNDGKFESVTNAFAGAYVLYYPYDPSVAMTGEEIPVAIKTYEADCAEPLKNISENMFSYSPASFVPGGPRTGKFTLKQVPVLVRLQFAVSKKLNMNLADGITIQNIVIEASKSGNTVLTKTGTLKPNDAVIKTLGTDNYNGLNNKNLDDIVAYGDKETAENIFVTLKNSDTDKYKLLKEEVATEGEFVFSMLPLKDKADKVTVKVVTDKGVFATTYPTTISAGATAEEVKASQEWLNRFNEGVGKNTGVADLTKGEQGGAAYEGGQIALGVMLDATVNDDVIYTVDEFNKRWAAAIKSGKPETLEIGTPLELTEALACDDNNANVTITGASLTVPSVNLTHANNLVFDNEIIVEGDVYSSGDVPVTFGKLSAENVNIEGKATIGANEIGKLTVAADGDVTLAAFANATADDKATVSSIVINGNKEDAGTLTLNPNYLTIEAMDATKGTVNLNEDMTNEGTITLGAVTLTSGKKFINNGTVTLNGAFDGEFENNAGATLNINADVEAMTLTNAAADAAEGKAAGVVNIAAGVELEAADATDAKVTNKGTINVSGKLTEGEDGALVQDDDNAKINAMSKDAVIALESTAKLTNGYIVILVDGNVTGAAVGEPIAYNLTSAAAASEAPTNATTIFVNCVLNNTDLSSIASKNLIVYQNIELAAGATVTGNFEVAGNVQIKNIATNDKSTEVTLTLSETATNVVNEGASLKLDKNVKLKGSAAGTTLDVNGGFDMNGGSIDGTTLGIE